MLSAAADDADAVVQKGTVKPKFPGIKKCKSRFFVMNLYNAKQSLTRSKGSKVADTATPSAVQHRQKHASWIYQRRCCCMWWCCIWRAGETLRGGLATERVDGSTIGIALRVRCAIGWCSFMLCW